MKSKKVILDTNLWISFLISKKLVLLDDLIFHDKIKLVFSKELIEEFITTAKRPKFSKIFQVRDIKHLLELFDDYGKLVEPSIKITGCRDTKDNFLLSLAVASKADYLVTGDNDLLVMKNIRKTRILDWVTFRKEISQITN